MERKKITFPCLPEDLRHLRAGDAVSLSGVIYTARDAAHKRMVELLRRGEPLPVDLRGQALYYAGPAPAKPGRVIGPIGPTTSGRMDPYTPALLEQGVLGLIGKGLRSREVRQALVRYGAVYFGATGGAAALLSGSVRRATVAAFEDLATEAIRRLEVEDFPLVVLLDSQGNDLYEEGPKKYRK
ncbi:MAG TPA: Fe-S-containing hydro-lyase [Synergistaceae bacterium]|nr:Fe-S-containing hydro-lyase [Synergistaceae bacterium]HPQ36562.1 Fe-S-containing hydro-lyase [Synergistaceae bacterium]